MTHSKPASSTRWPSKFMSTPQCLAQALKLWTVLHLEGLCNQVAVSPSRHFPSSLTYQQTINTFAPWLSPPPRRYPLGAGHGL